MTPERWIIVVLVVLFIGIGVWGVRKIWQHVTR